MSDERDDPNYRKYGDDFERKVDGCLGIAALTAVFWPLGLFVAGGMAAEHLYARSRVRRDRRKREQEQAAARAEALAEAERQRQRELALAEASRPVVPPPPQPLPSPEETAAAAKGRYLALVRIIDESAMDDAEKDAARKAAKQRYLEDLDGLL
jgi:hypothetical protein